jgi:hypothetical protein
MARHSFEHSVEAGGESPAPTEIPVRGTGLLVVRRVLVLTLSLVLLSINLIGPADAHIRPVERRFARLTNRVNAGYTPLSHRMVHQARRWSRYMAKTYLHHSSTLGAGCPSIAGEVVGVGSTVPSLWDALMDSTPHRAIIVSNTDRQGWGVVRRSGRLWVTGRFCGV